MGLSCVYLMEPLGHSCLKAIYIGLRLFSPCATYRYSAGAVVWNAQHWCGNYLQTNGKQSPGILPWSDTWLNQMRVQRMLPEGECCFFRCGQWIALCSHYYCQSWWKKKKKNYKPPLSWISLHILGLSRVSFCVCYILTNKKVFRKLLKVLQVSITSRGGLKYSRQSWYVYFLLAFSNWSLRSLIRRLHRITLDVPLHNGQF